MMSLILIVLGAVFQGAANAVVGITVRSDSMFFFLGCAFLIASAVGWLLKATDKSVTKPVRLLDCLWLNLATAVTFGAFYLALIWIPASLAAGAEAAAAPLAALSIAGLRGKRTRLRLWAIASTIFAISIAFGWSQQISGASGAGVGTIIGMALGIIAGTGLAALATISRRLAGSGVSAFSILAVRYHATYILAFACAAPNWQYTPPTAEDGLMLSWFVLLGFTAVALPLVLIQSGMMRTPATLTSVIMAGVPGISYVTETIIEPRNSTILSWILLIGLVLAVCSYGIAETRGPFVEKVANESNHSPSA